MKKYKKSKLVCSAVAFILCFTFITPVGAMAAERDGGADFTIDLRLKDLFFGKANRATRDETIYLCPGGDAFGVKICGSGVRVTGAPEENGEGGLCRDDKILTVAGKEVFTTEEVKALVAESAGECIPVEVLRGSKKIKLRLTPTKVGDDYQLGVLLSDGTAGIGTVTYINPKTGDFGGLGHGICDTHSGRVLPMRGGEATTVVLGGAIKGECGKPGELRGVLMDKSLGSLILNTECGVFGILNAAANEKICSDSSLLPIGRREEVKEGEATIISTVKNGKKDFYTISIESIDRDSDGSKSFRIKVTDPALIALTGGIVRGMSGSPIIQDGKLVGAVTHVMVANPTEGYGIFIENMLSAAQQGVQPKAA